jgi:hypothetical protein
MIDIETPAASKFKRNFATRPGHKKAGPADSFQAFNQPAVFFRGLAEG